MRELRKAQRVISHDVNCMKESIEPFQPMLQEMLKNRERMTTFRWTMLTVMGATAVTGVLSFLGFIGWLLFEWAKGQMK